MNRFTLALASATTLALAGPALAGNPVEAPADPMIAVAPVVQTSNADWSGFYGGVSAGYGWGQDVADDADEATYGVFGGYNRDFGDWVVGGELAFDKTELENADVSVDDMTRLKLRVGYDLGKVVVYGIAGANYANATIGGTDYSDTGYSYGIGADYALSDAVVAGFEVLQNDFDEFDNSGADLSATTAAFKIAYRF